MTSGADDTVIVAHVSDLHAGRHEPSIVDGLVADVVAVRPHLTVVTGDCTMRARPGQFRQARELIGRLPAPRLVLLGNHDVPLNPFARLLSPYAGYRAGVQAELDPRTEVPGLRAVGLASMPRWRWKGGRVSRRQAATVVDVLGAAPADTVRLLALHHPPFARGPARLAGRATLVRALVAARADLVLAGHTHVPTTRAVRLTDGRVVHRVVEVIAGTATSTRTRGAPRSWTVIRVAPDAIQVQERHEWAGAWSAGPTASYPRTP